jgi:HSP20 family protein
MKLERIRVIVQDAGEPRPTGLAEAARLEREAASLFDRLFVPVHAVRPTGDVAWHPFTDLHETPSAFHVRVELAGLDTARLEIRKQGRCLVIRGVRDDPWAGRDVTCHQMEIPRGRFERVVCVPRDFAPEDVHAEYGSTGFLDIRIDKERP